MRPDERQRLMIECLSFRRYDTIQNFADEFGVSWRTAHRDLRCLEREYPIRFTRGNGGGVSLPDGYYISEKHLTPKQADAIHRLIPIVCEDDREILNSILFAFAW